MGLGSLFTSFPRKSSIFVHFCKYPFRLLISSMVSQCVDFWIFMSFPPLSFAFPANSMLSLSFPQIHGNAFTCNQLGGMNSDPSLTFSIRPKHSRDSAFQESESDDSSTPKKLRTTANFNRWIDSIQSDGQKDIAHKVFSSGDESMNSAGSSSTATPPIINYRTSRRRKGIPHRAPF